MSNYLDLIQGKRVIFVGPAPLMIDKELGEWIDSFDVIARSNGAILLLDDSNYRKDYGSRCDVLYTNVQFVREVKDWDIDKWVNQWKIKFICSKAGANKISKRCNDKVGVRSVLNVIRKIESKVKGLLMGPIILQDLLDHHPADLWFTGMDFYISKSDTFKPGGYEEYYPGYLPPVITKKADVDNIGRIDPHDYYSNTRYLWSLIEKGKLNTNPFIKKIMQKILSNPEYYSYEGKLKRLGKK